MHAQITAIYVFQAQLAGVYPNTTAQYNMISATFVGVLIILLVRRVQIRNTSITLSQVLVAAVTNGLLQRQNLRGL
jgi:hypothetical protein